jgi:exodeoxyribonuclease V alpha subunit
LKIYKAYGAQTIDTVSADPYQLEGDIPDIGFLTADRIARALGVPFDAPARIAASMSYVLELAANEGHAYLPFTVLVERAAGLLGMPQNDADDMLRLRLHEGRGLVRERVKTESGKLGLVVYLGYLYRAEVNLAAGLRSLAGGQTDRLWQF